jgi:TonB-linked SusC/RagA family outer membrane protein
MQNVISKAISICFLILILVGKSFSQSVQKADTIFQSLQPPVSIPVSKRKDLIDNIQFSQETNVINSLQSKTSGVMVRSSSGSPGASSSIRIRGNRSVLFNNSPLIILDGMPIDNSTSEQSTGGVDQSNRGIDISQYDIASIQVLKSAHANVLYGIRGANGVILITTKKGAADANMKINLNYGMSTDRVNKLPGYQTAYAQGRPVGGVPQWRGPETGEGFSWGPAIADLEFDGSVYPYDQNGRLVQRGAGNGEKAIGYDNVNNLFRNGAKQNFNISIGGGKDRMTYYFSAGLLNQKGVIPNSDFYRKSLKLNIGYEILKNLQADISFNYINSGTDNQVQRGSNISGVPLGLFRTSPTFDNGNGKTGNAASDDVDAYQLPDGSQRSYRAGIYDSPYWSINKNPTNSNVNRMISQVSLNYALTSNLTLGYKFGIDNWKSEGLTAGDINSANFATGMVQVNEDDNNYSNADLTMTYTKSLSEKIDLVALAGYNYFSSSFAARMESGTGIIQPGVFTLANTTQQSTTLNNIDQKIAGLYLSIDLSYADELFMNLSTRNDWSSVLPENDNGSLYYGAEVVWDAAKAFEKKDDIGLWINGSWGRTGNRPGAYLTSTYYGNASIGGDGFIGGILFPQFGVDGFMPNSTSGNPNLGPEITQGYDIGFDLDILEARMGINYTFSRSITSDVIMPVSTSANVGSTSIFMNTGEIKNSGHEIALFATPVKNKWTWDISINLTKTKNKVNRLNENIERMQLAGFTSGSSNVVVGEPYGVLYGDAFRRNETGQLVIGTDGWPQVDPDGDRVLGNPNPDWIAGIQNRLSYKGITLSALLDIRQGGDVWNGTSGIMNYFGTSQLSADLREVTNFVFDGVAVDANGDPSNVANAVPIDFANPENGLGGNKWIRYGFGGLVEENIQDASWVRLRELSISYQLPNQLLSKLGISSSSVALVGRNLWLRTKYTGIDPETNLTGTSNGFGLDYFNAPNTKSYGVIFNFNF